MIQWEPKIAVEGVGQSQDPLNALNKLIQQRSEALKQTTFQATAAIMVNALTSIRAATLDARKHKKYDIKVEETSYYVGFSHSENRPCLRTGPFKNAPKATVNGRVIFLTRYVQNPTKNAHVYKVTQEKPLQKPLYIACLNEKTALEYAIRATKHRIDANGTLGKDALSVAIGKVAVKSFKIEGKNKNPTNVAIVTESKGNGEYSVRVEDNLDYATNAVKGGSGAIDIALQKAANKSYGYLAHIVGKDFTEKFPDKPFPEVNGKK